MTDYNLTFVEYPDYLFVLIKAETVSTETVTSYLYEIAERCHTTGHVRLLMERDITQHMEMFDTFGIAQEAVKASRRLKVAIVNKHPELDEDLRFAVTVAKNRGGIFELFDNVIQAEKWLLDSESRATKIPVLAPKTDEPPPVVTETSC